VGKEVGRERRIGRQKFLKFVENYDLFQVKIQPVFDVKIFRIFFIFASLFVIRNTLAQTSPSIFIQPQDQMVAAGYTATFIVGITNQSAPFPSVQWQSADNFIPNATNANFALTQAFSGPGYSTPAFDSVSFSITNAQFTNAGNYNVILSNSFGATTSSIVTLKIIPAYTFIAMAGQPFIEGTNDGVGAAATFDSPRRIAQDSIGNLYVTDFGNSTIRKITPAGIVSTFAGTPGVAGTNDGNIGNALFGHPHGIAIDKMNNIYISDLATNSIQFGTIRKITPDGFVTTIAGSPTAYGTNDGIGSAALFNGPWGLGVDNEGNLIVADTVNYTIRKMTPVGTNWLVTTIAGSPDQPGLVDGTNGNAQFVAPDGVAVDAADNIYIVESGSGSAGSAAVRKITPVGTNWVVTTLVGLPTVNGLGSLGLLGSPSCVAVDANTNLYVVDQRYGVIDKIAPSGTNWLVATIAGVKGLTGQNKSGTGNMARFTAPHGITVDQMGNLFVVDFVGSTLWKGWSADAATVSTLDSLTANTGQVQMNAIILSGSPTNFNLLQADQLGGTWTTNTSAIFTTNISGLYYHLIAPINTTTSKFFRLQSN
jgi:sugar lactone lactonase YvrE